MILRSLHFRAVKLKAIILIIISGCSLLSAFSQKPEPINLKEINQRKVRKYIVSREINLMPSFSSIHASWKKDTDESGFNINEKTYFLNYSLANVWDCYRHADPRKAWNKKSVRFGLLITKSSNTVSYASNAFFPEVDTGQVYFLNLRLVEGLFKIPVAFEIITIDDKLQIMEYSYIDNNKALGKQSIRFFDTGDNHTRIVHRSYFKSNSSFRDNFLYPFFHKKVINDFHRNMKHLVRKTGETPAIE
jgi:hypothetical protein